MIGKPIAAIAARIMAGEKLASFDLKLERLDHVGVKEAVFPFARFPGVDTVLGPEMRSTGEVMGIDRSFEVAFAKSQLGAGSRPPTSGAVFVSVRDVDKEKIVEPLRKLQALGFKILATSGTQRYLTAHGLKAEKVNKVSEGPPACRRRSPNGAVQLMFNTTEGATSLADSKPAPRRPLAKDALLHHNFRRHRGGRRNSRRRERRARSQGVAGLSGVTARKDAVAAVFFNG